MRQRVAHVDQIIRPVLGDMLIREVTSQHVKALARMTAEQRTLQVSKLVVMTLKGIFDVACGREAADHNAAQGVNVAKLIGADPARKRLMLTREELRVLLPALKGVNGCLIQLLLATGCRTGETLKAEWAHVELDARVWVIPPEHQKTGNKSGEAFEVPLTDFTVGIFSELQSQAGTSPMVFPRQRKSPGRAGRSPSTAKHYLDQLCAQLGIRRITPHDLRSTCRSWLTSKELGVPVAIAERFINHKPQGLIAVYDQGDYEEELREAAEKWGRTLFNIQRRVCVK